MNSTTSITEAPVEQALDGDPHDETWTSGQAGAGAFAELVRAHFNWERAGCSDGTDEQRYRQRLQAFEAREGELLHVYWATRRPSAVALTVKPKTGHAGVISDHDAVIRLHRVTREVQTFLVAYVGGGVGAVVSVLMRMSSNKFRVDFEVGRTTVRRLGSFRPFIGVVFGIALYFLLQSEILHTTLPEKRSTSFFFFGILAFLAGFNERWTNVLFGQAERTVAASLGDRSAHAADDDEEGR